MLTAQDRAKLRSLSTMLKDLVFVGKEGVTETVIDQINDNLYAHELIKIKVNKNVPDELKNIANQICDACDCELVSTIGSKILVYKPTEKPKFNHLL